MGKIKILIVDDIQDIRENICKLLEFQTEVAVVGQAATAIEAIERARLTKPDIVLMDINMPGMDGIAATEVISAEVPGVNIIMMSVQGEQEYLRRSMIAGAKNYLTKPFTGDELLQATAKVLKASISDQHMIARLGGDEFAILCVDTVQVDAEKICQHLEDALNHANISAALGMAMRDPSRGLLHAAQQADLNMYQAKKEKIQT